MNILITGVSSGLGQSLMRAFIRKGDSVFGLSRNKVDECHHVCCDLADLNLIEEKLNQLLVDIRQIDIVILNAGILGDIKTIDNWTIADLNEIMNINVWSNKVILDWLLKNKKISQVIAISSGASIHTYKGWSGYSLSKTALKMLMEIYSKDFEGGQFISVAPGLVDTPMQDYLCNKVNEKQYPVTKKFIAARKDGSMKSPDKIAEKFIEHLSQFKNLENGSYIDFRDIT